MEVTAAKLNTLPTLAVSWPKKRKFANEYLDFWWPILDYFEQNYKYNSPGSKNRKKFFKDLAARCGWDADDIEKCYFFWSEHHSKRR